MFCKQFVPISCPLAVSLSLEIDLYVSRIERARRRVGTMNNMERMASLKAKASAAATQAKEASKVAASQAKEESVVNLQATDEGPIDDIDLYIVV